ncbi:hypothetical protein FHT40_003578 [Mycolicibacterium sp. BK556]|uniref:hypothetical protein n=1 Tax=Mycobacteriaceae TaxID=1762 RepID=UPI00105D2548|nr:MULTISPECIES: hypothetical protein [Mycobacteriaceae]MBB3603917.1 hypothetical protein [Mycolicibacterium sp. BK556]MBB3634112.1 hypothetical protein [Mycolicibacterium sp. BK607]MBB3751693.1 hypothetical protein [Mycolicibacterium sp. BK634]TDO12207.1 hypothetical protein EV580_3933 [Mycobacterium sp. BK086]
MRKFVMGIAAASMIFGSLAGAVTANAASTTTPTPATPRDGSPIITALDCRGGTGNMGCGAGFFWRDGWRGYGCYPC